VFYYQSQFHRGEGTPAAEGQQTLRKSDSFQGGPLSRFSSLANRLFGARVLQEVGIGRALSRRAANIVEGKARNFKKVRMDATASD
jgi:hypothetical protein